MIKMVLSSLLCACICTYALADVNVVTETPKFALPKNITYVKDGKPLALEENKIPFSDSGVTIDGVSNSDLKDVKPYIEEELSRYPKSFINENINKVIVASKLKVQGVEQRYYVGPDYIIIPLHTSFLGLKNDYETLAESLHAAIGLEVLHKHHNYMMLFLFNGGDAPSKNKSYSMDELIERGYVSDYGIHTFDQYIAEYYRLIYTHPTEMKKLADQSSNVNKRLCLAISMYQQEDKGTQDYMTSQGLSELCQEESFAEDISIDLSDS